MHFVHVRSQIYLHFNYFRKMRPILITSQSYRRYLSIVSSFLQVDQMGFLRVIKLFMIFYTFSEKISGMIVF